MAGQVDMSDYSYRPTSAANSAYPKQAYTIQTILAANQSHRSLPMHTGAGMSSQGQSVDERFTTLYQSQASSSPAGGQYSTPTNSSVGKSASYVEVIARKPPSQSVPATGGNPSLTHAQLPARTSSPEEATKRRRRGRVRFTDDQIQSLERRFREEQYLPASERNQLASSMDLSESQVKTWFQNRRAKTKRALKRLRKARAAQVALNSGRQVPNVNIATTWMNSSQTPIGGGAAPYSFQPMQFGVDGISSPAVSIATPMEAYLYCPPTATDSNNTVAYQTQPAMPSASPHPQFLVGGLAVNAEPSHRHLSPSYHTPSNPVLPQYNEYMHVPTQRALPSSNGPSASPVPVVRGGYPMSCLQVAEQAPYQHRHL